MARAQRRLQPRQKPQRPAPAIAGCLARAFGFSLRDIIGEPAFMNKENVVYRLISAQKRLDELVALNRGNLLGADIQERQQLVEEFFFHLIGAIEILAQLVNDVRALGIDSEDVSVPAVVKAFRAEDQIAKGLRALFVRTRRAPVPEDPYTDDGLLFRAYNYRHQVTHRGANPFLFQIGSLPRDSFYLDPRDCRRGHSNRAVQQEMQMMKDLVSRRCDLVLALL
jgi:hypothetical protein